MMSRSASASIAIIGAGPSGIGALFAIKRSGYAGTVKVFEQGKLPGGLWNFSTDFAHSSVYEDMVTNLPHQIMAYPDHPYSQQQTGGATFLPYARVAKYLHEFVDELRLQDDVILYNHRVLTVVPRDPNHNLTKFNVVVKNLENGEHVNEAFDSVIVCNGHYFDPSIPDIPGTDKASYRFMHSYYYRSSQQFKDKHVVVIGCAASGEDIAFQLLGVAKKVTAVYNKTFQERLCDTFDVRPHIVEFRETSAVCVDGSIIDDIDVVLYCTGYRFTFPFLDKQDWPVVYDKMRFGLYQHVVHHQFHRLFFIGLRLRLTMPCFYIQSMYAVKVLQNECILPATADMIKATDALNESQPKELNAKAEVLAQFEYLRMLCKETGLDPLDEFYLRYFLQTQTMRAKWPKTYKNKSLFDD